MLLHIIADYGFGGLAFAEVVQRIKFTLGLFYDSDTTQKAEFSSKPGKQCTRWLYCPSAYW